MRISALSLLVLILLLVLGVGMFEQPRPIAVLTAMVSSPAPARAAPRPPGVRPLVVALPVDAGTLDPSVQLTTGHALSIVNHLFEPLARPDHRRGGLEPVLATSWKNLSPTIWEIKLRRGVRFSNGRPFNAEAVAFSVNRLRQPAFKDQEQFLRNTGVVETRVIDDYTVHFVTGKPVPLLPEFLSMLLIAEPSHYRDLPIEKAATTPVGTGPFTLVEWVKDDHLSLVANPKWWGGEVKTDVIIFRPIREDSTRVNEVATGGVDLTTGFSSELAKRLEGNSNVRVVAVPGSYNTFVGMRQEFEPFKRKEVRHALNLAVDVRAIIEALLDGKAKPIGGIANGMYENKEIRPYATDVSRARQLLAAAGYPNGFRVTMGFPTERYIKGKEVAQAVAADLGKIGLQVELKPYEWSLYLRSALNRQTDPLYLFSIGGYFTGQQELFWVHPDNVVNNTFWRDDAYLRSYAELASSFDPQRRMRLVRDLQARVFEEAPWLFLYKAADVYAISTRIQEWEPEPSGRIWLWGATLGR